jgi:DNA polymerase I
MDKKTLLILDGHNIFIRSFSGLMRHGLSAPDGSGTWGAFGAFNTIASMVRKYKPSHALLALDKGRSAKRLAIDPEYKANRRTNVNRPKTAMEEAFSTEFKPQFANFIKLCETSGIPFLRIENTEADDIIATAALKLHDTFENVVIISADHDLHQLIRNNIIVVKPSISYKYIEEEIYNVQSIMEEWGVEPWRLPEIWSLMGDKGDNVKGIPGIGPKKATKLIAEHGDLASVLNLEDPKISNHIDVVLKAQRLITLNVDEDLPFPALGNLQFNPTMHGTQHAEEFEKLLDEMGFVQVKDRWKKNTLWKEAPEFGRSLR